LLLLLGQRKAGQLQQLCRLLLLSYLLVQQGTVSQQRQQQARHQGQTARG
jgi:hypothetical protein